MDENEFDLERIKASVGYIEDESESLSSSSICDKSGLKEFQTKLILEVQSYILLYDKSSKHYRNAIKRTDAWRRIGLILNRTGEECRTSWDKLRNTFRQYYNGEKKNPASGSSGRKNIKKWEHYELMEFLKPCMDNRATIGSYQRSLENEQLYENIDESTDIMNQSHSSDREPRNKKKDNSVDHLVEIVSTLVEIEKTNQSSSSSSSLPSSYDYFYKDLADQANNLLTTQQHIRFKSECYALLNNIRNDAPTK